MHNLFLDAGTTGEIDKLVDRLHRDLGNPDGAVDLAEVRDLLKLDLRYYSSEDPTLLQEMVHRMRIGTKQVVRRPALLLDAIKKFDLKGLFLPDRKRILLDANLPDLKKRWSESHETLHSIIPWHKEYLLGDTKETLSPGCHEQLEAEANYGAGRLLFPSDRMLPIVQSANPSIAHIKSIASHFGNTITSALWRFVEHSEVPCLGVIGEHPHYVPQNVVAVQYFIRSRRFASEFGSTTEDVVLEAIRGYCSYKKSGPLGTSEVTLIDDRGTGHVFRAETFSNRYQVLTLLSYMKLHSTTVAVTS